MTEKKEQDELKSDFVHKSIEDTHTYFTSKKNPVIASSDNLEWFEISPQSQDFRKTISRTPEIANKEIRQLFKAHQGHPSCFKYLMEKDDNEQNCDSTTSHPSFFGYRKDNDMTIARAQHQNRYFNIDTTPKLVLSAGKMVDLIVASGVGNYLEFKSVDGVFHMTRATPSSPTQSSKYELWRIPSSKADIFNTKLFNAIEKRQLMKIIQYASDYGREVEQGSNILNLNEVELAKGRSLHRPQNKLKEDIALQDVTNQSFVEFLTQQNNKKPLPIRLQQFILHSLCLHSSDTISAHEGLLALFRHINASNRYGTTSFLATVYGTSEFSQAFCRLSAVWGGIFMLGRRVTGVLRSKSGDSNSDEKHDRLHAVMLDGGKMVACDHLVCDEHLTQTIHSAIGASLHKSEDCNVSSSSRVLVQRTSVCNGCIVEETLAHTGVIVIPPHTLEIGNEEAIFVIQEGYNTLTSPAGCFVIYLLTYITNQNYSDEELQVKANTVMDCAIASLLSLNNVKKSELLYATCINQNIVPCDLAYNTTNTTISNLHAVSARNEHLVYIHDSVVQAERIIRAMYPSENLYFPPKDDDQEDDEEQHAADTSEGDDAADDHTDPNPSGSDVAGGGGGGGGKETDAVEGDGSLNKEVEDHNQDNASKDAIVELEAGDDAGIGGKEISVTSI